MSYQPYAWSEVVERIRNSVNDPIAILGGDDVTVSGTDLVTLLDGYDRMSQAIGIMISPSFKPAQTRADEAQAILDGRPKDTRR